MLRKVTDQISGFDPDAGFPFQRADLHKLVKGKLFAYNVPVDL